MKTYSKLMICCLVGAPVLVGCDDDGTGSGLDAGADASSFGGSGGGLGSGGKGGSGTGGADAGGDAAGGDAAGGDAAGGDAGSPDAADQPPRGANARPTALGAQIDRSGRPAISTATIATFSGNMTMKDARKNAYNTAMPAMWPSFTADIAASLGILDALDAQCGNQLKTTPSATGYTPLAQVLADDQLYLNTGVGECGVYLGVEAEAVGAVAAGAGKCGGRTPMDDVIDRSYSLLAAGVLSGVTDGVQMDNVTHSLTAFPFLAAP